MMSQYLKHYIHSSALICLVVCLQVTNYRNQINPKSSPPPRGKETEFINPESQYQIAFRYLLLAIQATTLLGFPTILCSFLGLILFDAFPGEVKIKNKQNTDGIIDLNLPHICFRVVTRGTYPQLVQHNVNKNYQICLETGLINFCIEVVTDKDINLLLPDPNKVKQVVVPKDYSTKTRAMYKARALQYALDDNVNELKTGDYIVHLDEETIMTRNSVHGIINFVRSGKHSFGQGYITYASQGVVNWLTTMADFQRVGDDMGKLRFQFKAFHKPIFSWKGSYVVCKFEAELDVNWDNGPESSITEDCYFAIKAFSKGYSFDFIEGEMWEKSPFTIMDTIRQRKRWIQGMWLVIHSKKLPFIHKFFLSLSVYAWTLLPITTLGTIISIIYPQQNQLWLSSIGSFIFAVAIYLYIFGVFKSFYLEETKFYMICLYTVLALIAIISNILIENVAVIWGLFGEKYQFYIVQKEITSELKINLDA